MNRPTTNRSFSFFRTTIREYLVPVLFITALLLVLPSHSAQGERLVVDKQSYSGDYSSIQDAVDNAEYGDTIYVKPGIYEENIDLKDGITLEGAGKEKTTITSGHDDAVMKATGVENVKVIGFTLQYNGSKGHSTLVIGDSASNVEVRDNIVTGATYSGIEIYGGSSNLLIENNIMRNNEQSGIYVHKSSSGKIKTNEIYGNGYQGVAIKGESNPLVENNTVKNNEQSGIYVYQNSSGKIKNNEIYGNRHGVSIKEKSDPNVVNNTIVSNDQNGVWVRSNSSPVLKNNIIVKNKDGIDVTYKDEPDGDPTLSYNNVWGNKAQNYEGIYPPFTSISRNPQFVDPNNHDYHLKSTSPCIGAGSEGGDLGAHPY